MNKSDPILDLIDNYCRSYNKENKKRIYSCWYYIPTFIAAAAVMYWYFDINRFLCLLIAMWGFFLSATMILNRRMSLAKLKMQYSDFKKGGPQTGVISDDFISLLADSKNIDNYA
ncbi:TPA: hypothetical protein KEX73_004880, partial [Escherichia coli]|nr:hypothetical protein [Escherichia coli]